jgi:hypothetical protein
MAKIWILDTETKGTGAQMVPLDKAQETAPARGVVVAPERVARPEKVVEPRGPRKFKVVDVMTREVLAEGANARVTVDLLKDVRSMVDVSVYVWEEQAGKWQQLAQREQKMLWDLARGRRAPASPGS